MTGREMIIYILENNLEDKEVFEDGRIFGLLTSAEAAVKFNVGVESIKAMYKMGMLRGIEIGKEIYIYQKETEGMKKDA